MKLSLKTLACFVIVYAAAVPSHAQCTVASNSGYSVHLNVYPEAIVPATMSCPYGYNYQVRMRYDITFSGSNIPSELYTLQGRVHCGSTNLFFDLPNNGGSGTVLTANDWTSFTNCSSATPGSLGCNTVNIEIEGQGLSARTIPCGFSSLPIELIHFEAAPITSGVAISWSTATETNNDHFTVERSIDGQLFEPVAMVGAVGNSHVPVDYSALDPEPLFGLVYYRLRQTDADGSSSVSAIKAVEWKAPSILVIHPNPAGGSQVRLNGSFDGLWATIVDFTGVEARMVMVREGSLDITSVRPGVHHVRMTDEQGVVHTARLVRY